MAASLAFPLAHFSFIGWRTYQGVRSLANERIIRSLDLQQEMRCSSAIARQLHWSVAMATLIGYVGHGLILMPVSRLFSTSRNMAAGSLLHKTSRPEYHGNTTPTR
jgi:hypothetical protein